MEHKKSKAEPRGKLQIAAKPMAEPFRDEGS
jgi:hypothetical protein